MREFSLVGTSWEEARKELFTLEEIAEGDLRVALIGEIMKIRQEQGISQRQLEKKSGVRQPVIARTEHGTAIPSLGTMLKVLMALGEALYIEDLDIKNATGKMVLREKPYKNK